MIKSDPLFCQTHPVAKGALFASLLALLTTTSLLPGGIAYAQESPPQPQANVEAPVAQPSAAANPEEDYKAGRTAYEGNDWFAAIPLLRSAATAGHLPAMVMLATILTRAAENQEAMIWYNKAAQGGSLDGAYWLGTILSIELDNPTIPDKNTPPPDPKINHGPEEALKWLTIAAEGAHPAAMFSMFTIYAQGKLGQKVEPKTALDWLQRSADKGFTPAMKELAVSYTRGLLGLAPNPKEAERWNKAVQATEPPPTASKPNQKEKKK